MLKKLPNKCAHFLVLVLILLPDISLAFNNEVRCQILKDAISFCPKHLQSYLTENFVVVHEGMHFADRSKRPLSAIRPNDTEILYERTVKDLREGKLNDDDTMHRFGLLACFVAETISPGKFKTTSSLVPKTAVYDGFQGVASVDDHVSDLVSKYRNPYRHSKDRQVTDFLYNVAVNEIIDHWVSAWQAGGQEPGVIRPQGARIVRKNKVVHFQKRRG